MDGLAVPQADLDLVASTGRKPRVAIVAGSGLGGLAAHVGDAQRIAYTDLPGFPRVPNVIGHAGELVLGTLADVPVMVFAGRVHLYQGVSALDAAYTARLAAGVGAEAIVLTNAAGSLEKLRTGDIMLIRDHINLTGQNPLVGWPGPEGGTPFVPMTDAWDDDLATLALEASAGVGVDLKEGVYAGLLGPSYETPAEVRMLRELGADVVGMSTVMEAIAARALGLRILGMSLVTNAAAGEGLSHAEVLEAGKAAARQMEQLMTAILQRFASRA